MEINKINQPQYMQASLLLPWFITGKLTVSEKKEVESVLSNSSELQHELEQEKALATMVHDDQKVLNLVAITTQDQRLENLLDRINATLEKPKQKQQTFIWTQLPSKIMKRIDDFLLPLSNQWARTAFSLFIVVQVAILAFVINKTNDDPSATDAVNIEYIQAGDKGVYVPSDKTVLIFQFTIQAEDNAIQQLFKEIGAVVSEHPEGSTNYTVTLSGEYTEDDIDRLIRRYKNNEMIRLVGRGL